MLLKIYYHNTSFEGRDFFFLELIWLKALFIPVMFFPSLDAEISFHLNNNDENKWQGLLFVMHKLGEMNPAIS